MVWQGGAEQCSFLVFAPLAKLVAAIDLGAIAERHGGSSPSRCTKNPVDFSHIWPSQSGASVRPRQTVVWKPVGVF